MRGEEPTRLLSQLGALDTAAVFARAALEAVRSFDPEPARAIAVADTIAAAMTLPDWPRATRVRFLLTRAGHRLALGRFAAADSLIREAQSLDPSGPATLSMIGIRALVAGTDPRAARAAARALGQVGDDISRFNAALLFVWAATLDGDTTDE